MDLSMIDYVLLLGLFIIAALIIAYCGLDVEVDELDPIDNKAFKETKHKKH